MMSPTIRARIKKSRDACTPTERALCARIARCRNLHVPSDDRAARAAVDALVARGWAYMHMDHLVNVTDAGRVAFAVLQNSPPKSPKPSAKRTP